MGTRKEKRLTGQVVNSPYVAVGTVILAAIAILVVGHVETKKQALEAKIYACWNCEKPPSMFEMKDDKFICVDCGKDNLRNINEWLKLKRKPRRNLDQSS